jgi:DNA polymerase III epsilon subunit-like protein
VFVDTETTGLDPDRHEIWEVGLIYKPPQTDVWQERTWFLPVDLGRADSFALKLTDFHSRYPSELSVSLEAFARMFAKLTRGKHLCGAVISFDEERLRKLLKANGACPEWHYHLIDVEALAVGYLAAQGKTLALPWDSEELSAAVGVEADAHKHEALADARWAKRIYEAVTEPAKVSA